MTASIGKLERVALREVWKHEALDFTQWLQENIDVLNSALDLNLVNVDREQIPGAFSVDLVAEDEGGATIIIENQLEKSNHDHLGKLITYLTAMSARAAIWIVSDPRPEHVAAITWLNESIDLQKMNWKFRASFQEHTGVSLKEHLPDHPIGGYTRVPQDTAQSCDCQRAA